MKPKPYRPTADPRERLQRALEDGRCRSIRGIHPYADLFPMVDDATYERIKRSIREIGQVTPVMLTDDGLLLDGRARVLACCDLILTPRVKRLGQIVPPLGYVEAMNRARQHLDDGQVADALERARRIGLSGR